MWVCTCVHLTCSIIKKRLRKLTASPYSFQCIVEMLNFRIAIHSFIGFNIFWKWKKFSLIDMIVPYFSFIILLGGVDREGIILTPQLFKIIFNTTIKNYISFIVFKPLWAPRAAMALFYLASIGLLKYLFLDRGGGEEGQPFVRNCYILFFLLWLF